MSTHSALPAAGEPSWLDALVHRLEHVLPAQAPIRDFVHHNTLHGFQHLPFREAVAAAEMATGAYGYLPAETFRAYFAAGRIDAGDLDAALDATPELDADAVLRDGIVRRDVLRVGLHFDLAPLGRVAMRWRIDELGALARFQDGVPDAARASVRGERTDAAALAALWST
jgi:hypothetical protein